MTLKTQAEVIKIDLFDTSGVRIIEFTSKEGEKIYRLTWTDYVVNTWTEHYDSLAMALARVAVLAHCIQNEDSMLGYKTGSDYDFAYKATLFLDSEVS